MTVAMILRLVDEASGPLRRIMSELEAVQRAARSSAGPAGNATANLTQPWRAQVSEIGKAQSAVRQFGDVINTSAGKATATLARQWVGEIALIGQARAEVQKFAAASHAAVKNVPQMPTAPALVQPRHTPPSSTRVEAGPSGMEDGIVQGVTGAAGAVTGKRIIDAAAHAGADAAHQGISMQTLGMSPADQQAVHNAAVELTETYKRFSATEIEHVLTTAVPIMGSYEHAREVTPAILQLRTIFAGQTGQDSEAEFDDLIKGLEIMGAQQSPERFHALTDLIARQINVFKGQIKPSDYVNFAKQAGSTIMRNLDPEFLKRNASVMAELGGDRAGTALSTFLSAIAYGRMGGKGAEAFDKIGWLNEDKVERKGGHISKVHQGAIKNWQLALRRPDLFIQKFNQEFDAKFGTNDETREHNEAYQGFVGEALGDPSSRRFFGVHSNQRHQIDKDVKLQNDAPGMEAWQTWQRGDPSSALAAVGAQITNFLRAGADPAVKPITGILDAASTALNAATNALRGTPLPTGMVGGAAAGASWFSAVGLNALLTGGGVRGLLAAGGSALGVGSGVGTAITAALLEKQILDGVRTVMGASHANPAAFPNADEGQKRLAEYRAELARVQAEIDAAKSRARDPAAFNPTLMPLESRKAELTNITAQIEAAIAASVAKAQGAGQSIKSALDVTAQPQVDASSIDEAIGKAERLRGLLEGMGALAGRIGQSITRAMPAPSPGGLHDGAEAR